MKKLETQNNRINEADYIDIPYFVRSFLRLVHRYLLLVCPIIVCLIVSIGLLSRALVKQQYVAEASFVVGVTLSDDFSYNYTLPEINDYYIEQMSEAFRYVIKSEYMYYLLEEELGGNVPGDVNWENTNGTNIGRIIVVSDSMENAEQLRDAMITCLPKALFTTLGDIELKVIETSERAEVSHEQLKSPLIWIGAGVTGGLFVYLGIIFLMVLWRHDIETSEDMLKITDLPCLGNLPKSRKLVSNKQTDNIQSNNIADEYNRSFSEFRKQLKDVIEQQQIKTLLFTGGYKKRGQTEILDKLNHDWIDQGKKILYINMDLIRTPKTGIQICDEHDEYTEKDFEEADLLIINGPDYEQTVELLTIADAVDGIVYIVKAGYDQLNSTEEAISVLGFTQAKLLGYVLTA